MRILYDTTWSTRGVLQAVGRKPRAKDPFDFQVGPLWETLPDMCCTNIRVRPSRMGCLSDFMLSFTIWSALRHPSEGA